MVVFLCLRWGVARIGGSSCTSGFSINLTDHPHAQLPRCPSSPPLPTFLLSSIRPSLAPCTPRSPPLSCTHTYTHILTHALPPWSQRSSWSRCSHVTFHYHDILSQFWNGGGGKPFLFIPTEGTKLSAKIFFFTCNWNCCWLQSQKPERQLYLTV